MVTKHTVLLFLCFVSKSGVSFPGHTLAGPAPQEGHLVAGRGASFPGSPTNLTYKGKPTGTPFSTARQERGLKTP